MTGLVLLLGLFTVFVVIDVPIAVALGLASAGYLFFSDLAPIILVAQRMVIEGVTFSGIRA